VTIFKKGANVIIEIFDNRVEITNPGGLPGDLKEEEFGTKSVVRNPIIASLLLRANYIERIGTGINRMIHAVKTHGKGTVSFTFSSFFTVTFTRLNNIKTSGKTSGKIIELVQQNSSISIPEMASIIGITERSVERNIQKLQKSDRLKRIGGAKGGYWKVEK